MRGAATKRALVPSAGMECNGFWLYGGGTYEEFCLDAGLGEPVRLAMAHAPKDAPLLARARDAVGCKNQEAFQEACKEGMDRHEALFPLVALAECYPLTKQYYPDTRVRRATLGDIAIWVRHYAQKTGGIGVEHYRWLSHHACGTLVRLGHLQYEEAKFPFPVTIVRTKGGRTLVGSGEEGVVVIEKGMSCLFVHIPEGSPLDVYAVDDSLVQARDWFPDYPVAVCVS